MLPLFFCDFVFTVLADAAVVVADKVFVAATEGAGGFVFFEGGPRFLSRIPLPVLLAQAQMSAAVPWGLRYGQADLHCVLFLLLS